MAGIVIYRGPSALDRAPIVVVATRGTINRKTGPTIQTWILRADRSPVDAVNSGADRSVCGDCPLRGTVEHGRNRGRTCYVLPFQGPQSVFRAYRRGIYRELSPDLLSREFAGDHIRLGAYGDPAAVPRPIWDAMTARAEAWTGYTHLWRTGLDLRDLCMASCDNDRDARDAIADGWRVFRITEPGAARLPGSMICPSHRGLTCRACRACNGTATGRRGHIQIGFHGGGGTAASRLRTALPLLRDCANISPDAAVETGGG
jgi:hypothetical protein